jgi:hypothetical protein
MGLVDRRLWENRHTDPAAIEAELRGPKGRGWLTRWIRMRRPELYGPLAVPTRLEQDTQAVRFDKKGV